MTKISTPSFLSMSRLGLLTMLCCLPLAVCTGEKEEGLRSNNLRHYHTTQEQQQPRNLNFLSSSSTVEIQEFHTKDGQDFVTTEIEYPQNNFEHYCTNGQFCDAGCCSCSLCYCDGLYCKETTTMSVTNTAADDNKKVDNNPNNEKDNNDKKEHVITASDIDINVQEFHTADGQNFITTEIDYHDNSN